MLRSLAVLGGRAAVLLGRDPEAEAGPAAPGSLADLVARAERLTESARFAIGQLESIRAQAEHTQGSLASTLDASAGTIELLARRQQELGRALLETVHTTEQARESLESRARQFLKAIESPPPPDPSTPEPSPPSRRHGRS
jgi:ABC-type transporter Mla subunit MlaD